jgi:SAM-dependent methyltransferase
MTQHSMSCAPAAAPALESPEFGLALGLIFGRHFIGMEDLHYGYWTDDLPLDVRNLPAAQARYTEELIADIPRGVRTILDVGMGAGNTAKKLIERGFEVDGVSPNAYLTSVARQRLGDRARIFECKFEDVVTDRRYDLMLFSESFLFMDAERALEKAGELLNDGGYVLICDIFRLPAPDRGPIGGGKELAVFRESVGRCPFDLLKETDISKHIAPTFDVLDRAYREAVRPAYDLINARLRAEHPLLTRLVRGCFRKKFDRLESKHFSGKRTGASFLQYKSYRRFVYRKRRAGAAMVDSETTTVEMKLPGRPAPISASTR